MRLAPRLTIAFTLLAGASCALVGVLTYLGVERLVYPIELTRLQSRATLGARELEQYLAGARTEVVALLQGPSLRDLRTQASRGEAPTPELEDRLAEHFLAELGANGHYLQLRLIDASEEGRELVRVDRSRANLPLRRVARDELQAKGHRSYFRATAELSAGELYVSPIEWNRERGILEEPFLPVVRVGAPVHDLEGRLFAVLVLNIDLEAPLAALASSLVDGDRTYLLNEDGDFLVHPDPEVSFAFERGVPVRWQDTMPGLAPVVTPGTIEPQMVELGSGSFGVSSVEISLAGDRSLRLLRTLPADVILAPAASVRGNTLRASLLAFAFAVVMAVWSAYSLTRPLRRTTRALVDFRPGSIVELPDVTSGEIGVLARTFEAMSADLKDHMEREERLHERSRQSQKLEAVGKLAGGVAHDFNNLLTVVMGYSSTALEEMPADHPARRAIEQVLSASDSAAALTRQLLAFSRRQVLKPEVLDINPIVRRTEQLLRRLIEENIDLVVRLAPELGHVCVDPSQVEQVVMNLAINGRDAMPDGGQLVIETANVQLDEAYMQEHEGSVSGPHVMIAVKDSGQGMDPARLEKIFEPFFTTKEMGRGTGLGLSTVYGIVKQSGGNIWVYSEPGHGTLFKVYLPCVPEVAPPLSLAPSPTVRKPAPGSASVLLVEDSEVLRELMGDALMRGGHTVLTARDAEEALEVSRSHSGTLDLLLTDIILPGTNGRVLADRILLERPDIVVVFMSGYTDDSIVHGGILDPGTNFIEKPVSPAQLLEKLEAFLAADRVDEAS